MKKTNIAIIMTVAVLAVIMAMSTVVTSALMLGDADGDKKLSISDATTIQRHLARLSTMTDEQIKAANVSGSKELNIMDATLIQRRLALLIDRFPAEDMTQATEKETEKPTVKPTEKPTERPTAAPTQAETLKPVSPKVNIHFTNNKNWSMVYAYVFNYATGTPKAQWPGELLTDKSTNSYSETVYHLSVDTSKYDRIIFSNGSVQTTDTPVTVANSGYFVMTNQAGKMVLGVYPYGQDKEGNIRQVNLNYSPGYDKRITIWTPVGYNANDKSKKYSVLYMTDGQNIFGNDEHCAPFEWECDETVLSLMQNGGDGIIVVGVDNANNKRDNELTPNLGPVMDHSSPGFENGTGEAFSHFVVDKVIPFVEANYNTNSKRGIAGSSSGGLEAFYIGMENLDKFDYVGAVSPAFLLFSDKTWDSYLSGLDLSDKTKLPRIYFYNGKGDSLENMLLPYASEMQTWLKNKGYPDELMTTKLDDAATHNEKFWAIYFPELLSFGLGYQK